MFDFNMVITAGEETVAHLVSGEVTYMVSTCNGSVIATATAVGSFRVSCMLVEDGRGMCTDSVYLTP